MQFRVYFKHMDSSLAVYAYAEQKIGERLDKYRLSVVEAHLTFAVENGVHRASCHFVASGGLTMTVESDDALSMYAAVDRLADKIDARLRRKKEKMRSHRLGAPIDLAPLASMRLPMLDEDAIDAGEILSFERARAFAGR